MGPERANDSSAGQLPARVSQPRTSLPLQLTARRLWIVILLFALTVFVLGMALDFFLVHQKGLRPFTAAVVLNALFALVAALLVHRLVTFERTQSSRMLQRIEIIDEMNHHIRNALQVISFSAHGGPTQSELAEIKNAVNRIQWAVSEILPRVEPEFSGFEGSAREQPPCDGPDRK